MNDKRVQRLIDFQVNVRMGNPVPIEESNLMIESCNELATAIRMINSVDKPLVAAIFEFASIEPTNQFMRYSTEDFQEIFDAWLTGVDTLRDALNS